MEVNNAINCRGSEILQRSKRQIDGVARLVFASALSFLSSKILPGEQSRRKIVDLVKRDSVRRLLQQVQLILQ